MSKYYKEDLQAHEYCPDVPDQYRYLEKEHQWLLVKNENQKIAFLRYCYFSNCFTHRTIPVATLHVHLVAQTTTISGILTCTS